MRTPAMVAVSALLVCAAFSAVVAQTSGEPYTFFKQYIGLKDDEIADLQQGKVVTKTLPTKSKAEIALFAAVYIHSSPEEYLKAARTLQNRLESRDYLGIRRFSTPPKLSDLQGFVLEEKDIQALKDCSPGNCDVQLPGEAIEKFKSSVNWSAPDVTAQANALAQKMALDEVIRYQKEGDAALGAYFDKEQPVHVAEQFNALLGESRSLSHYLPDLKRYLTDYPRAQLANAEDIFYWERVKFGLKPTLRINHMVIYHGSGPSGPLDSIAVKQIFASHYFQNALDLSVCANDTSRPNEKAFYLITVKGSSQKGLASGKGAMIRGTAVSRSRSAVEHSMAHIKHVLESSQEATR